MTLIITITQLYMDYKDGVNSIDKQFELIESSYVSTLTDSLWVDDQRQINLQLKGLLNLKDIIYCELLIEGAVLYKAGDEKATDVIMKSYDLKYQYNNKDVPLGVLHINADLDRLYTFLKNKIIVLLISQAIKTLIISFFILFIFHRLLTRHLERIARFLNKISVSSSKEDLRLDKKDSGDELDQVSAAINSMKNKVVKSHERLEEAQRIAKIGNWEWDVSNKRFSASREFFKFINSEDKYQEYLDKEEIDGYIRDGLQCPVMFKISENRYSEFLEDEVVEFEDPKKGLKYFRSKVTIHFNAKGEYSLLVGTVQDITSEYLIEMENKRLLFAIEQSPLLIFLVNKEGLVEYANQSVYKTFPEKARKILLDGLNFLWLKEDQFLFKVALKEAEKEGTWEEDVRVEDSLGNIFIMKTIVAAIKNDNNEILQFAIWQEDITKSTQLQKELLVQSKHAQMGEMIAMIAHQWRQPLTNISSLINDIRLKSELDVLTNDNVCKSSKKIEAQVTHLSQTIDDFSDFFKPRRAVSKDSFNHLLDKTFIILEGLIKLHGIDVENNIPNDVFVETYTNELVQVILNLIKNSIDAFTSSDSTSRRITLNFTRDEDFATFSFTDNAGGIPDSVIQNIFTAYFSTKTSKNGTGLGLYMSKTIIETHMKGKLEVFSQGDSSTFSLSFPLSIIS